MITLDDIKTRALLRAEVPLDSQRYEDGEVEYYINSSLGELYDILVVSEGIDRFLDAYQFNTSAGQHRYDLPVNFYKSAGLDIQISNKYYTLLQYNHSDRLLYQNATDQVVNGVPRNRYRIVKGHLEILPAPESATSAILHYVPQLNKLVNSSDTVNNVIVESWLEYVVVDVAVKLLEKDEDIERAALLKQTKQAIAQRIQASTGRDLETPEVVPDATDTLFNLRIQARYKANMVKQGSTGNDIVTDRELTHYINSSLSELFDILVKAYDNNYFLDAYQFTTESGRRDYNLPNDFYKLAGVDMVQSGETYTLSNYNFADRNYYEASNQTGIWDIPLMHYQLQGNSLRILPAPDGAYTVNIWYTPRLTQLNSDTDQVNNAVLSGWLEYVTTDAAIKMLNKAILVAGPQATSVIQTAIQNLTNNKVQLSKRIEIMAENRNWGQAAKMVNVYGDD